MGPNTDPHKVFGRLGYGYFWYIYLDRSIYRTGLMDPDRFPEPICSMAFRGTYAVSCRGASSTHSLTPQTQGDAVPKMAQLALATWRHYAPDYEVP